MYQAADIQCPGRLVLVKLSNDLQCIKDEYEILKKLAHSESQNSFPAVLAGGEFMVNDPFQLQTQLYKPNMTTQEKVQSTLFSYIVQQSHDNDLQQHLQKRGKAFSIKTVCQLGICLLRQLEQLHKLGKVYNNLKLSNIVTIQQQANDETSFGNTETQVLLTDFSFCSEYLNAAGLHIQPNTVGTFKGNIAFGSVYTMGFQTPSRRDDLISLTYLLIYLTQGSLSILDNVENLSKSQSFKQIYEAKKRLSPEILCASSNARYFHDFVQEIHILKFDEGPNYLSLTLKLLQIMNQHGIVLSNEYDWDMQPSKELISNMSRSAAFTNTME